MPTETSPSNHETWYCFNLSFFSLCAKCSGSGTGEGSGKAVGITFILFLDLDGTTL